MYAVYLLITGKSDLFIKNTSHMLVAMVISIDIRIKHSFTKFN